MDEPMAKLLTVLPWPYVGGGEADSRRQRMALQEQLRCDGGWRSWSGSGEARDGVVELALVRTAWPRLQLLAVEGSLIEHAAAIAEYTDTSVFVPEWAEGGEEVPVEWFGMNPEYGEDLAEVIDSSTEEEDEAELLEARSS